MGVQFGKSAVAAGQDYVEKNVRPTNHGVRSHAVRSRIVAVLLMLQFTRYLPLQLIKTSFDVTNSYVLRKLRLVLFPWRHKPWARTRRSGDAGGDGWMPPRDDINAPDLYIPSKCGHLTSPRPSADSTLYPSYDFSPQRQLTDSHGTRNLCPAVRPRIRPAE
jgi:hypothetical protein